MRNPNRKSVGVAKVYCSEDVAIAKDSICRRRRSGEKVVVCPTVWLLFGSAFSTSGSLGTDRMSTRIDRKVVHERLSSLIWRCLDNGLVKTAHFYAERLFAFDGSNHEARHLLATATLRLNQAHSALHLVTRPRDDQCAGCYEIAAKCSTQLGRHAKARTLLEYSIVLSTTSPISTSILLPAKSLRVAHPPPLTPPATPQPPQNHAQHASLPRSQIQHLFTATRVSSPPRLASPLRLLQALHALSNWNPSYGRHGPVYAL